MDDSAHKPLKPFWILWTGQALSLVGSQAVQFALIWWLTRETGSATVLATAALLGLGPTIILGPVIGALVDRWNRKYILFLSDLAVAMASLGLAALFYTGQARIVHVFAALLIRGLGGAFHSPAMQATTSLMVPEKHLTRIQGANQALQGGLNIIAAPAGALLLAWFQMGSILVVDMVTATFALLPLAFLRIPEPVRESDGQADASPSLWKEMAAGLKYLRERTGVLALVSMAAAINMVLIPAFSLLSLLVLEDLRGDAFLLGWMNSILGVGFLAGGVLLGIWGGFKVRIVTLLAALLGMGVAVFTLGMVPAGWNSLALAAMFVVGMMAPLGNGTVQAILQATVRPDYQGRVFTLMGSLAGAMAPLGLILAAPVADLLGVRSWYLVSGVMCVAMGILGFAIPAILNIEKKSPGAELTSEAAVAQSQSTG
jgi:DHA3 family macrolide efflux protein-like MFS transporter